MKYSFAEQDQLASLSQADASSPLSAHWIFCILIYYGRAISFLNISITGT